MNAQYPQRQRKIYLKTGQRFGKLVVIEYAGRNKHGHHSYKCKCDCGGIAVVSASCLHTGKTRRCRSSICNGEHGKGNTYRRIDLTGQKFGMLTVIRVGHVTDKKILYWECKCDCGNIKELTGQHLKRPWDAIPSCGCASYSHSKKQCIYCGEDFAGYRGRFICDNCQGTHNTVRNAVNHARDVEREYTISNRSMYNILTAKTCAYYNKEDPCENQDGTTTDIRLGPDRINNALGYIEGNVAPCCWKHNNMKSAATISIMHKAIELWEASPLSKTPMLIIQDTLS